MRPVANFTLHAVLAAAIAALASTAAASQSPPTLRIVTETPSAAKGGTQLEIESYSWGSTQAGATGGAGAGKVKFNEFTIKKTSDAAAADKDMALKGKTIGENSKDGAKGGNVEFEWKVEEGESAPPAPGGGVSVAAGDLDGDGRADVASAHEVKSPRDAASGLPTGKRQHKPMKITMPLDKGSVWVRVASPWTGCQVGTRYPSLELSDGAKRYLLQDVTVANCGRAADDRPTEEVAFYYNKVTVRGWNPETKQQ